MGDVYRDERRRLPRPGDDLPAQLWADVSTLVPLVHEQARGERFYGSFMRSFAAADENEDGTRRPGTAVTRELAGSRGPAKYVAYLMGGAKRPLDGAAAGSDSDDSDEDEDEDEDVPNAKRGEGGEGSEDGEPVKRRRMRKETHGSSLTPGGKRMPAYTELEEQLMLRGRALSLQWDDVLTLLPRRTKQSITKYYYGTLKKKNGGDPTPVPDFHDAEMRAMKTACGEAQARGEQLDFALVAEAANEARRELTSSDTTEPLAEPRNAVDAEIFCRLKGLIDGHQGDDDGVNDGSDGTDDDGGGVGWVKPAAPESAPRSRKPWQSWEMEAIYRGRRAGQSWEDISIVVPERSVPAIQQVFYKKLHKKRPEELGLPADLPNAEDANREDAEGDQDGDDGDDTAVRKLAIDGEEDGDSSDDDVPLTSLL